MTPPQPRRGGSGRPAQGGGSGRAGQGGQGRPGRSGNPRPAAKSSKPAPRRPVRPTQPAVDVHDPDGVRLQKVLATAGLGSRRACEQLIEEGRVEVDGQIVVELGVRVDPKRAVIHVDGLRIQLDDSLITIALNKPKGVVSTMHDPEGRPSVGQYFTDRSERLFHVGRLDADTEGLMLFTNDGELANRLAHPSHGVAKTYLAEVQGKVVPSTAQAMQKGIELEDGFVQADKVTIVQSVSHASLVEITLHEGKNRIVRRMFDEVGHPVTRLVRTKIGPIRLGDLKPGRTRVLGKTELGTLMSQAGL